LVNEVVPDLEIVSKIPIVGNKIILVIRGQEVITKSNDRLMIIISINQEVITSPGNEILVVKKKINIDVDTTTFKFGQTRLTNIATSVRILRITKTTFIIVPIGQIVSKNIKKETDFKIINIFGNYKTVLHPGQRIDEPTRGIKFIVDGDKKVKIVKNEFTIITPPKKKPPPVQEIKTSVTINGQTIKPPKGNKNQILVTEDNDRIIVPKEVKVVTKITNKPGKTVIPLTNKKFVEVPDTFEITKPDMGGVQIVTKPSEKIVKTETGRLEIKQVAVDDTVPIKQVTNLKTKTGITVTVSITSIVVIGDKGEDIVLPKKVTINKPDVEVKQLVGERIVTLKNGFTFKITPKLRIDTSSVDGVIFILNIGEKVVVKDKTVKIENEGTDDLKLAEEEEKKKVETKKEESPILDLKVLKISATASFKVPNGYIVVKHESGNPLVIHKTNVLLDKNDNTKGKVESTDNLVPLVSGNTLVMLPTESIESMGKDGAGVLLYPNEQLKLQGKFYVITKSKPKTAGGVIMGPNKRIDFTVDQSIIKLGEDQLILTYKDGKTKVVVSAAQLILPKNGKVKQGTKVQKYIILVDSRQVVVKKFQKIEKPVNGIMFILNKGQKLNKKDKNTYEVISPAQKVNILPGQKIGTTMEGQKIIYSTHTIVIPAGGEMKFSKNSKFIQLRGGEVIKMNEKKNKLETTATGVMVVKNLEKKERVDVEIIKGEPIVTLIDQDHQVNKVDRGGGSMEIVVANMDVTKTVSVTTQPIVFETVMEEVPTSGLAFGGGSSSVISGNGLFMEGGKEVFTQTLSMSDGHGVMSMESKTLPLGGSVVVEEFTTTSVTTTSFKSMVRVQTFSM
jgi:hypothetical protein